MVMVGYQRMAEQIVESTREREEVLVALDGRQSVCQSVCQSDCVAVQIVIEPTFLDFGILFSLPSREDPLSLSLCHSRDSHILHSPSRFRHADPRGAASSIRSSNSQAVPLVGHTVITFTLWLPTFALSSFPQVTLSPFLPFHLPLFARNTTDRERANTLSSPLLSLRSLSDTTPHRYV